MSGSEDKVKIIHVSDLRAWARFPEYRDHDGLTLGEYRSRRKAAEGELWGRWNSARRQARLAQPNSEEMDVTAGEEGPARLAGARAGRDLHPLLFVSHRWNGTKHPDPEGRQLARLQALEGCFLIYDYASFPQDTAAPEDEAALRQILLGMNALISHVLVLAAPDFLERGWCIYEYLVSSMRATIVCDELNDPNFVLLRNLAATVPPLSPRLLGHSVESSIQNSKNQRTLETVNTILPLFNRSKFTVGRDRAIVRSLLVSELMRALPAKMEYVPHLGEWKRMSWKEEELREAFTSELKWQPLDSYDYFKPFAPKVPSNLAEAVMRGYKIDRMPVQDEFTFLTLLDWERIFELLAPMVKAALAGVLLGVAVLVLLAVVLVSVLVWWFFF